MGCVVVGVPELRTHLPLLVWRPSAPIIFHQMMQTKKNPTGVIRRDKCAVKTTGLASVCCSPLVRRLGAVAASARIQGTC